MYTAGEAWHSVFDFFNALWNGAGYCVMERRRSLRHGTAPFIASWNGAVYCVMERRRLLRHGTAPFIALIVRLVSVGVEGNREVGDPDVLIGTLVS
jgi:hypothetical protein